MTSVQYRQNLLARTFLGFDREAFMEDGDKYPRYNIVREESADRVSVEIAVPGFGKDDVSVEQDGNKLIIKAKSVNWLEDGEEYLHKGFSSKAFEKNFTLGDFMEVDSVRLQDGVLTINVVKNIPEDKRPKIFDIE